MTPSDVSIAYPLAMSISHKACATATSARPPPRTLLPDPLFYFPNPSWQAQTLGRERKQSSILPWLGEAEQRVVCRGRVSTGQPGRVGVLRRREREWAPPHLRAAPAPVTRPRAPVHAGRRSGLHPAATPGAPWPKGGGQEHFQQAGFILAQVGLAQYRQHLQLPYSSRRWAQLNDLQHPLLLLPSGDSRFCLLTRHRSRGC